MRAPIVILVAVVFAGSVFGQTSSLSFNAANTQYVTVDNMIGTSNVYVSFTAWVKFTATSGDQAFLGFEATGDKQCTWWWDGTAAAMKLTVGNGSATTTFTSDAWSPSTGVWYQVGVTLDASYCMFYHTGVRLSYAGNVTTAAVSNSGGVDWDLGASNSGAGHSKPFNGSIACVGIFSGTSSFSLSSVDMADIYGNGMATTSWLDYTNVQRVWAINEGSGTTITDSHASAVGDLGGTTGLPAWASVTLATPPAMTSPEDEETDVLADASFSWSDSADAASYRLYYGATESAVTDRSVYVMLSATAGLSFTPSVTLGSSTTYYWVADSVGDNGTIGLGTVRSFTTDAMDKITSPSPADTATGTDNTTQLLWTADPFAVLHRVFIGTSSATVLAATTSDAAYQGVLGDPVWLSVGFLDYSTAYYWRIDEVDSLGNVTTGSVLSFTTEVQPTLRTLTMSATNGAVSSNDFRGCYRERPAGIFEDDEVAVVSGMPNTGYCFDSWTGAVSGTNRVRHITMDGNKSITANFKTWEAPIGIPIPSFGITQTYRMYDTAGNRNESLTYNASPDAGYYTHYVDSTHGSATNTDNPYGSPSVPRLSPPIDLPAGSVVEIHNASTSSGWGEFALSGEGTSAMPIFIRGVGTPTVSSAVDIGYYGNASYIIMEGISVSSSGGVFGRADGVTFSNNHICVRNCEFTDSSGTDVVSWTGNSLNNIVFYANTIYDNGTWDPNIAEGDEDYHGISIGGPTTNVWCIDNEFYHNSGCAVQINGNDNTNHIYVGRNVGWQNKQTAFWTKTAADVVFSQNVAYLHRPSSSSNGGGLGCQYDPKRVWFLLNESYDNAHGIESGSANAGGREEWYYIGNVIYHCTYGFTLNGIDTPDPAVVAANTIYDCQDGIYNGYYTCKLAIENNILSCSRYYINFPPDYPTATNSDFGRNLVHGGTGFVWGEQTYGTLAAFQSGASEGVGSVEADPLFVSSSDLRLQASSPAVNAGSGTGALQTAITRFDTLYDIDISKDLEGVTRPQGAGWDMGAYEYEVQSTPVKFFRVTK